MRTVGMIGGIGPESTVAYYRQIISRYRDRRPDGHYPQIIISSIDMTRMLGLISAGRFADTADYLAEEIQKLERAGADFALLASNTPHIVFDSLQAKSRLPLVSIIEAACREARRLGLRKVGLFGTKFTMQGGFYGAVFSKHGIDIVTPNAADQETIHEKYMGELVNGIILDATKRKLLEIASRLEADTGIEGLILGGTELPLILSEEDGGAMPFLDTTKLHVESVVDELLTLPNDNNASGCKAQGHQPRQAHL